MTTKSKPKITLPPFDAPIPSPSERRAAGKALRQEAPRTSHAVWEPTSDRHDPIEVADADQTERDHRALLAGIERGALSTD